MLSTLVIVSSNVVPAIKSTASTAPSTSVASATIVRSTGEVYVASLDGEVMEMAGGVFETVILTTFFEEVVERSSDALADKE